MSDKDKSQEKPKPLNNNSAGRWVSDCLDKALGTSYDNVKESKIRATFHGAWHAGAGVVTGNQREFERAKDQWNSGYGGATDNLAKYDAAKKKEAEEQEKNKKLFLPFLYK